MATRARRAWVFMAGACILFAVLSALTLRELMRPPEVSPEETALQDALAGVELQAVVRVELQRLREALEGNTASAPALASVTEATFASLGLGGLELTGGADTALLARFTGERGPGFAVVLFGAFSPQAIEASLRSHADSVTEQASDGAARLAVSSRDPESCALQAFEVSLRADRVLVMVGAPLDGLLESLGREEATATDPSWALARAKSVANDLGLRSRPLLRAAWIAPGRRSATVPHPGLNAVLHAASAAFAEVVEARLAVTTTPLGSGLEARLDLEMADTDGARALAERWRARILGAPETRSVAPAASAWIRALTVDHEGSHVTARAERGAESLADLLDQPDAWITLAATLFPAAAAPGSAQLEAWPVDFRREVRLREFEQGDPNSPLFGVSDIRAGPFGIRVDRVTRPAQGEGFEIDLRVVAPEMPNLPEPAFAPRLVVDTARGIDGAPLVTPGACGEREHLSVPITRSPLREVLEAEPKLHLMPGAALDDVANIQGRVELEMPVRTTRLRGPARVGEILEADGLRIEVIAAEPGGFAVRARGDVDRLLAVRGLAESMKPLASPGAWSTRLLRSADWIGARPHAGEAAAIEAIVALDVRKASYPFVLGSARPGTEGEALHVESSSFIRFTPEQFEAEFGARRGHPWPQDRLALGQTAAGPFTLAVESLADKDALEPRILVLGPEIPNLTYDVGGLDLAVRRIVLEDGATLVAPADAPTRWTVRVAPHHRSGREGVEAAVRVATGLGRPEQTVARIEGELVLRLRSQISSVPFPHVAPGASARADGVDVTLVALGRDRVSLELQGPRDRLFSLRGWNADGKELSSRALDGPLADGSGPHLLSFEVRGLPERLVVQLADASTERKYPFAIDLVEPFPAAPAR